MSDGTTKQGDKPDDTGDDLRAWISKNFPGRAALGLFLIAEGEGPEKPPDISNARTRYRAGASWEAHIDTIVGQSEKGDQNIAWAPPEGWTVILAASEEAVAWVERVIEKPHQLLPNGGHWLVRSPFDETESASGDMAILIPCPDGFERPDDRAKDPCTISTCVGTKGHIVVEMPGPALGGRDRIVQPFDLDAVPSCPEALVDVFRASAATASNRKVSGADEDLEDEGQIVDDGAGATGGDGIDRSSPADPCYVCGGNQQGSRGTAEHCGGYRGRDSAYCTKIEFGDRRGDSGAYRHYLRDCECDHKHERTLTKAKKSRKTYDSHEEMIQQWRGRGIQQNGKVYQLKATYPYAPRSGGEPKLIVARFEFEDGDKTFRQGSADGRGKWSAKKNKSVLPMLYRWREMVEEIGQGARTVYIVEGEKDVDAMVLAKAVATSAPGGAAGGVSTIAALAAEFKELEIRIVAHRDSAGYKYAAKIFQILRPIAASVSVLEAKEGNDAADALAENDLESAFKSLTIKELAERAGIDPNDLKLIQVLLNNDELRNQMAIVSALKRRSDKEFEPLVRGGQVVRVRDGFAEILDAAQTRNIILDVAQARREDQYGRIVPGNFSREFICAAVARASAHFFELKGITASPALQPDGSVVDEPGFDPATGLFYAPPDGFEMKPLPGEVTKADFDEAVELYNFAFGNFAFATETDKANGFAAFFTATARSAVDGIVPGFLIDAPTAGSGKTKFAEAVMIIAQGRVTTGAAKSDRAEMAKSLEAMLGEGRQILLLDNIQSDSVLDSSVLAAIMTAPHDYTFRLLGKSKSSKAPMRAVVLATGNNVTVSRELARRLLRVRIDTGQHDPASRPASSFNVPYLTEYLGEKRSQMVRAALVILRWTMIQLDGGWTPSCETRGDMHGFWRLIGGAVELAGWGSVGMAEAMDDIAFDDTEHEADFGDFLEQAHGKIGGKAMKLRELADATEGLPYHDQVLIDAERGQYSSWHKALSYIARKHKDKPHRARSGGTWALAKGTKNHGTTPWQIKEVGKVG